jgi:hypothetical protein
MDIELLMIFVAIWGHPYQTNEMDGTSLQTNEYPMKLNIHAGQM